MTSMRSQFRSPALRRRGVTMLGLIALTALLAIMCSIILDRSLEVYQASGMLESRLAARAAAEGVAAMMTADPAHPPKGKDASALKLGAASVTCGAAAPAGKGELLVPMTVKVRKPGASRDSYAGQFKARYSNAGSGWRLLRVEE